MAGVVVMTACTGGGDDPRASATSVRPGPVSTTAPSQPTTTTSDNDNDNRVPESGGVTPIAVPGTDTVTSPGFLTAPQPTSQLVGIRQSRHDGFVRIVFDFVGPAPHFRVGYVKGPLRQPGSGNPVDIAGSALLEIHMEPAATVDFSTDDFIATYEGPTRINLGGPSTQGELLLVGEFEGNLVWAVGTDKQVSFAAGTLTGPSRMVVDVFIGGTQQPQ